MAWEHTPSCTAGLPRAADRRTWMSSPGVLRGFLAEGMAILPHIDSDSDTLSRNCHSTAARPRDMPKQGAGVPAGERCLSQWLKSWNKERCWHCYHTRCMATEPHKPCHKQMLWLLPFRITVLRQREWLQQMLSASRKPVDVVANPKPEC